MYSYHARPDTPVRAEQPTPTSETSAQRWGSSSSTLAVHVHPEHAPLKRRVGGPSAPDLARLPSPASLSTKAARRSRAAPHRQDPHCPYRTRAHACAPTPAWAAPCAQPSGGRLASWRCATEALLPPAVVAAATVVVAPPLSDGAFARRRRRGRRDDLASKAVVLAERAARPVCALGLHLARAVAQDQVGGAHAVDLDARSGPRAWRARRRTCGTSCRRARGPTSLLLLQHLRRRGRSTLP